MKKKWVLLTISLFVVSCGVSRKEGWTDERVDAAVRSCESTLESVRGVPRKNIEDSCECWIDDISSSYTFSGTQSPSESETKDMANALLDCMDKNDIDTEGKRLSSEADEAALKL